MTKKKGYTHMHTYIAEKSSDFRPVWRMEIQSKTTVGYIIIINIIIGIACLFINPRLP
jgi:hypothetical protein